ncbi:dipeptidase PepE [Altibacter sp.]|uniref:dipeptidase PepE n=1 Tax=Altibacter sp. TaxID=2024823 RepID=UPI0025885A98|nr:dipeptidase PepE [Altibacter sp.]MCW9038772.1 dipeptidase PepE [Altibacter sp.]
MKNLIVASTSTVYGGGYLDYLSETLSDLFKHTNEVIFIPYARPGGITHDAYTEKASEAFKKIGKELRGLHTFTDPQKAIREAKGIFTGGGNTFVLVTALHQLQLMQPLREAIFNGLSYLGTSAGSNICGISMQTTNDMPIVYPPSFKTLGVVPFNINPHYLDPDPSSTHMGETRETRINEFHTQNTIPVIGLREGSWLEVKGAIIKLRGDLNARIFEQDKEPYELTPNSIVSF